MNHIEGWKDEIKYPTYDTDEHAKRLTDAMCAGCMKSDGRFYVKNWAIDGNCKNPNKLIELLRTVAYIVQIETRASARLGMMVSELTLSSDRSVIHVTLSEDRRAYVRVAMVCESGDDASDPEFVSKISDMVKKNDEEDDHKRGAVYALTKRGNSVNFSEIGEIGRKMRPLNYSDDVVSAMASVRRNIRSRDPDGRLSILSGDPGTGKTHLIMDLARTKGISMILLDPRDVTEMSSPELVSAMFKFINDYELGKKPVLVLEDGDSLLVRRASDNMSYISSMLNMCDGLRGKIMDFRLIVTTNAKKLEMDSAIMRPGRLHKHILVEKLSPERASQCLLSLAPSSSRTFDKPTSLAEVYRQAREDGWKPKLAPGTKDKSK